MLTEKELIAKLGDPFTTRQRVAEIMLYKDPHYVDEFLIGLPRIKTRYFSKDVAERLLSRVEYKE